MVDIVTPTQVVTARPAGPVSTATADALGKASAVAGRVADKFTDYYEEKAAIANDLALAKAQDKWTAYLKETGKTAGSGYAKATIEDYDAYVSEAVAGVGKRGGDDLKVALDKYRIRVERAATEAEAASRARAAAAAKADAYRARGNALVSDPSLLDDMIEQDPKNAATYVKIAANARMSVDPVAVGQEFQDGKWDAYVSPSEKQAFINSGTAAKERIAREKNAELGVLRKDAASAADEEIAFTAANGAPPADSQISEDYIRHIFPQDQADEFLRKYKEGVEFATVSHAAATMAPDELVAQIEKYSAKVAEPGETETDVSRQSILIKAVTERQAAIDKDAAGHVSRYNDEVSAYLNAYNAADGDAREIAAEQYTGALEAEYDRLGIPDYKRNVIPKSTAAAIVENLKEIGADLAGPALLQVMNEWGNSPKVISDLKAAGLPMEYAHAMRFTDNPGLAQSIASLAGVKEGDLKAGIAPSSLTKIDETLSESISDYAEAFTAGGDVAGATESLGDMYSIYTRMVLARIKGTGEDQDKAAASVKAQLFPETIVNDTGSIQIVAPQDLTERQIRAGLASAKRADALALVDLAAIDYPGLPPVEDKKFTEAAARNGVWVNNASGTGATLMLRTKSGYMIPLLLKDGNTYDVPFADIPDLASKVLDLNNPLYDQ